MAHEKPRYSLEYGPHRAQGSTLTPASVRPAYTTEYSNLDAANKLKQKLALSALTDRYQKYIDREPRSSSKDFFNWLQDFGSSMQTGATKNPNLNLLGALGRGFAGASEGRRTRLADLSKVRSLDLQSLGAEMSLLETAAKMQPREYMSPSEAVAAGFHKKDKVLKASFGQPSKVVKAFKTTPVTFEKIKDRSTFTVPQGSSDVDYYRRHSDDFREISKARAKDPEPKAASVAQKKYWGFHELDKVLIDHEGNPKLLEAYSRKAVHFQDTKLLEDGIIKYEVVEQDDDAALTLARANPNLTEVSAPTPRKAETKTLTGENTSPGGKFAEHREFWENRTEGDTPTISGTGVLSYVKPSPKKKKWQPLTADKHPEQFKQWEDVTPPGMMAVIDKNSDPNDPEIKMVPKRKMSWITFTDPKGDYDPITLREDETEGIDLARNRGMIRGQYRGDISGITKSSRSRWRENKSNITDGREIVTWMRERIARDRNIAGTVGMVRTFAQSMRGIAEDFGVQSGFLANITKQYREDIAKGNIESEVFQLESPGGIKFSDWFNPDLAAMDKLETALIYKVAQSNKSSSRLNVQDLLNARNQVSVTGWNSMNDVINNLDVVDKLLAQREETYGDLLSSGDERKKGTGKAQSDYEWDPVKGIYFLKKK